MIYFTELENIPFYDARGEYLGCLVDLAIEPGQSAFQVSHYLVRSPKKETLYIGRSEISTISIQAGRTSLSAEEIRCSPADEAFIRIKKDVVDQHLIDINNKKVVRAIDVDFDTQPFAKTDLRVLAVEVGAAAAVRRLLQGFLAKHRIRSIASVLPAKAIPWESISLIEPDPSRRAQLRISYEWVAKMHPADLADMLEELSRDERRALVEPIDEGIAAAAVSEVRPQTQVLLLNSLPTSRAAAILGEMTPDKAANVLQQLPPETSGEILNNMEQKEANDIRTSLEYEEHTAGRLMTTDFVLLEETATVGDSVEALRYFARPLDSVHSVYLIAANLVLTGVIPLARLLVVDMNTPLCDLATEPVISVPFHADEKNIMKTFNKYNLLSLPVVDDNGRLLGVIAADDILKRLIKKK